MAGPGDDTEIWAQCYDCDRWFYCERWFDTSVPAPTCPVCGSEPSAIVNRAAHAAEQDHVGFGTASEHPA